MTTAEVVYQTAQQFGGEVQIELSDGWTWDQASQWRRIGIDQAIIHRSRDAEARGNLTWGAADFDNIRQLADMGYRVTVTGGVKSTDIQLFAGLPIFIFIAGRSIRTASDPAGAARELQDALTLTFANQDTA